MRCRNSRFDTWPLEHLVHLPRLSSKQIRSDFPATRGPSTTPGPLLPRWLHRTDYRVSPSLRQPTSTARDPALVGAADRERTRSSLGYTEPQPDVGWHVIDLVFHQPGHARPAFGWCRRRPAGEVGVERSGLAEDVLADSPPLAVENLGIALSRPILNPDDDPSGRLKRRP